MIVLSDQVKLALKEKLPIVAFESTIISHGMPYPENVQTALLLEEIVAKEGVIPATIGIIGGNIVVGMSKEQIEKFGKQENVTKVSRRDLSYVVAQKKWGATTVSATMMICHMVGIEVFVTGGIGGVHFGAENTFDISADLEEFTLSNVTVISAGAKAILNLELTLEYLETKGVPVLTYQSDDFANFYSSSSGLKLNNRVNHPKEIAEIITTQRNLNINGGLLVSNPIPKAHEIPVDIIDKVIQRALHLCEKEKIKGKDVTPFLLKEIVKLTKGKSLLANKELIKNNAVLGAQIAKELSNLQKNKEKI
ncbi:MAG: pseudouridine-5'-phosphate glycosidase [Bacilli bacterium]|jgi:pseudouridine-5'-phosphate glycosidase|nr:pseudouridine-5'-phosphate glycosidase [Bacilli bacterium]NLN80795.1 pseudouridine-5'-phosphate glycosidase [Erysipelotrichia bacterium]